MDRLQSQKYSHAVYRFFQNAPRKLEIRKWERSFTLAICHLTLQKTKFATPLKVNAAVVRVAAGVIADAGNTLRYPINP